MYELEEVQYTMRAFLNELYEGQPIPEVEEGDNYVLAPDGYVLAFTEIGGRGTILLIPENKALAEGADGKKA